jgi:hypothetical protein
MPELPWEKWYPTNWASEPGLRLCEAATRGIWFEAINTMMLQQTGSISGTIEQLASLCVCLVPQMQLALEQLKTFKVANVGMQNDCIILSCRKRLRDCNISDVRRDAAKARWSKPHANALHIVDAKQDAPSASASASASVSVSRFIVPELPAIKLQAAKIGLSDIEAEKFFNYYTSNGWRVGKNPMKSWTHALSTWKINAHTYGNTNAKNGVQRIDRSIGTANEGIASRYKDFGKVVKPPNP